MTSIVLKRSDSKDDTSSSLRDSGISISEKLSENDSESIDSNDASPKRKRRKSSNKGNHRCEICGKGFGGGTDLRRHLLIHTNEKPHKCDLCPKAYRQAVNLSNHKKVAHSSQKEFTCRFCMKQFALKQRLRLHLRVHTGEKPYSCPHCSKKFARGGQLQQHLVTHDERIRKSCEICLSTFSSDKNLKQHMQRHAGNQKHNCKICKKIFASDKALRVHLNVEHAGVRQFECQLCEKTISEDMQTHMKIHAPTRPFECEVCKAAFAQRCQYVIHMRTHTGERPFTCRVCWQSFGHSSVLKLHIRKHTGEKPFKCLLCKETHVAFSQLSHLKTHMKSIHRQDKAYVCEACRECFKAKFNLENHLKTCEKFAISKDIKSSAEYDQNTEKDADTLARIRYLMAVLLKNISSEEKLSALGFEKRLIDNVLIASLKLADRKCHENKKISELNRMKLNIQEFLEWIVPAEVMDAFKKDCPSIENILDKIVTMYLKKIE